MELIFISKSLVVQGKRVIVVEKNHIIGTHIIELLKNKGHQLYNEVHGITELHLTVESYKPDVIIINKSLFFDNQEYLYNQLIGIDIVFFIVLYTLTPNSEKHFSFSRLNYIEKPFMAYEIADLVSVM